MATLDQLFQAMGMFSNAAKEYGVSQGIQDATKAVNELKQRSDLDFNQQIAAQQGIATQLQSGLAGLGAPQAQIAAAVGAIQPPKIQSSADALAMAQRATNPEERAHYLSMGKQFSALEGDTALATKKPTMALQHQYDMELQRQRSQYDYAAKIADAAKELPADVKKYTETLGAKVGNQTSIANTLATAIEQWDNTDDESTRLQIGREILKTINSPEGADAVGAEEVKRLGSKLEFAMGNLFNSNELQLGRDLPGFRSDLETAQNRIAGAVNKNKLMVERSLRDKRIPDVKSSSGKSGEAPPININMKSKTGIAIDPARVDALRAARERLKGG